MEHGSSEQVESQGRNSKKKGTKPLGQLIGAFKTVLTKRINQVLNSPGKRFWQRNYFEHVIRGDYELEEIRNYIRYNPDKEYFNRKD